MFLVQITSIVGDMAPDDIGYLPLYKPDIEGAHIFCLTNFFTFGKT